MKKIFLISELFYPNKTSTAYIMTEIAKHLAKNNHVSVICSDIVYDSNYSAECNSELQNIDVIRTKSPEIDKNKMLSRLVGSFITAMAFGKTVKSKVKSTDTVFAVTNPFLLVLTLAILRHFKKFDYVLLVHDVFPENAVPAGLTNPNDIVFKLSKMVYDWAYSKADRLVVLGRDMKAVVEEKISSKKPIYIIENWYDEDTLLINDFDRDEYVGRKLSNKLVIGFAGNNGRVQNLKEFIELFAEVKNDKLHLLLIGDGAMRLDCEEIVMAKQLKNVTILGAKPRSEQSLFLNCFDIGLITLSSGMYGLGVPSKTYNLLALGKPLLFIGDKKSELDVLIKENSIGWAFDWSESNNIINFLNSLDFINENFSNRVVDLATKNYTVDIINSKIEKVVLNEN